MGLLFPRFNFIDQCPNLLMRLGEVPGHDRPHPRRIDAVIGMSDNVAEPPHLVPRKTRVLCFDIVGQIRGGLADDLQGPFDGVPELAVLTQVLQVVPLGEGANVRHRLVNVGEILCLTPGYDHTRERRVSDRFSLPLN